MIGQESPKSSEQIGRVKIRRHETYAALQHIWLGCKGHQLNQSVANDLRAPIVVRGTYTQGYAFGRDALLPSVEKA